MYDFSILFYSLGKILSYRNISFTTNIIIYEELQYHLPEVYCVFISSLANDFGDIF